MEKRPPRRTALHDILSIDQELMKLIHRRSNILHNLRSMRNWSAKEKTLREAWEEEAARLSRDPMLVRRLFGLLQEIEVLQEKEIGAPRVFLLSPPRQPVDITLPGMPDQDLFQLFMGLAAAFGAPVALRSPQVGDAPFELMKALNHAGAEMSVSPEKGELCGGRGVVRFADQLVHAGDDALNFYLLSSLALRDVGKVKFTGGGALKTANLAAWRNTLPQCGARFVSLVPKSSSLPAHQECSAVFASPVALGGELPREAVFALTGASCAFGAPVEFDGSRNPWFERSLDALLPALGKAGVSFRRAPGFLRVEPGILMPRMPELPLDPWLTAVFLAFPLMAGGRAAISGRWDADGPAAASLAKLLEAAGLELAVSALGIEGRCGKKLAKDADPARVAAAAANLETRFLPLALVLLAAAAQGAGGAPCVLAGSDGDRLDPALAQDFLERLGFVLQGDTIRPRPDAHESQDRTWTSPDAAWALAYSLGSYLRPGLKLANPGMVAQVMPSYWTSFFNGLPTPSLAARPKPEPQAPKPRRRIIAGEGVWPEEKEEE